MLARLSIKNVALIEHADIEFDKGLNVLSGETGAGKSVILDSVNFVLGAKADRSMIRYGENECSVRAEFILPPNSKAIRVMEEMDIESDGEVIITRKFSETGKNSIKLNGNTVTATMLRKVTDSIVDVHGQSEHFYLLSESNQLKMLDTVIGAPLETLKTQLNALLREKKEIDRQMALLGGDEQERNRRLDLLDYQIDEIQKADLKEGEEEELKAKRIKIGNLEKIMTAIRECTAYFSEENGISDALRGALRAIGGISKLDEQYLSVYEKIDALADEAENVSETLHDLFDELYFDETEAETVERRLDEIRDLFRKYGENKQAVDAYLSAIQSEYELLSDSEEKHARLSTEREKVLQRIYATANKMHLLREKEGNAFCRRVIEELKTLYIPKAQFSIDFAPFDEKDADRADGNGLDRICFMFSANAGEPIKPLGKIISGGEMSRFMLAIKTQLGDLNEISTYIFDEIDAGISGKTAKVVGEKLARIATDTQVIAVSHLAQIAVMSDGQYLIEKTETGEKTHTNVYTLDVEGKKKEIIRLLGGEADEEFAVKHAEELLKQAETYKREIV